MRRLVRERCDHLVALPLFGHVGSLNVSVAAGIALYEVIRQRGSVPSQVRPIAARAADAGRQVVGPRPEDAEEDPGHSRAPDARFAGEDTEGGEEGDEPGPRFIRPHEEDTAWASPPQILKAAPFRSRHAGDRPQGRRGPHGRGRRFGKGRGRPTAAPSDARAGGGVPSSEGPRPTATAPAGTPRSSPAGTPGAAGAERAAAAGVEGTPPAGAGRRSAKRGAAGPAYRAPSPSAEGPPAAPLSRIGRAQKNFRALALHPP